MKKLDIKNKKKVLRIITAIYLVSLLFICIIWVRKKSTSINLPIDYEAFGTYGDFIGGIVGTYFAIIGVVYVYYTYKGQSDFQQKDQVESRFFELLKLHEKNVEELKKNDDKIFAVYIKNIKSFVEIIKRYNKDQSKEWNDITIVKLGYLYFFYGASEYTTERLEMVSVEPADVNILNDYIKGLGIVYNGSYEELGKYFRQLFQIVTYIDTKDLLTYKEKEQYIKSLRVRLNIDEQYIFFLNSLVSTGLDWEKGTNTQYQLITKYNLLKNIPIEYNPIEGIIFHLEYPHIQYEFMGDKKSVNRIEWEKQYLN